MSASPEWFDLSPSRHWPYVLPWVAKLEQEEATLEQEEALAGLERAMRSLDEALESGQLADIRQAAARLAAYAWLAGRRSR